MPLLDAPPIDRVILLQSPPPDPHRDAPPSVPEDAPDTSHPIAFPVTENSDGSFILQPRYKNVPIIVINPAIS